jgi:hypothetical protein
MSGKFTFPYMRVRVATLTSHACVCWHTLAGLLITAGLTLILVMFIWQNWLAPELAGATGDAGVSPGGQAPKGAVAEGVESGDAPHKRKRAPSHFSLAFLVSAVNPRLLIFKWRLLIAAAVFTTTLMLVCVAHRRARTPCILLLRTTGMKMDSHADQRAVVHFAKPCVAPPPS